jgi:predicted nucleic acid-binding protein
MDDCVIDASVVIPGFVTQPLTRQARALLGRLDEAPPLRLLAPDLLYAECANALWKYVRYGGHDAAVAAGQLARIRQLPLGSTPTLLLVDRALALAVRWKISAYDACYVALADLVGCPLVTADERLVQRLAGGPGSVRWLGAL